MTNNNPIRILDEVQGAQTIAISGHIRPDGDCVGSCLGMARYLQNAMPECRIDVFLGAIPSAIERHATGADTVNHDYQTDVEHYDVFICLDCSPDRLGEAVPIYHKAARTINIDHHQSNPGGVSTVEYIVPGASSACELVYNTLDADGAGAAYVDEGVARNLYIGMVTDTGEFKFSSTSRSTMEIAGRLIEYGFDFPTIVREVYDEKTYLQQLLLARALTESVRTLNDRCIYSAMTLHTLDLYGAQSSDTDGIVSQLLNTYGCVCSIFMYELRPQSWKVSLRSTGEVNVAHVCECFGGGGHERASGCTVEGQQDEVLQRLLAEIALQLPS